MIDAVQNKILEFRKNTNNVFETQFVPYANYLMDYIEKEDMMMSGMYSNVVTNIYQDILQIW
jgi:hypothetical protein